MDLTHKPNVLYLGSIERMAAARRAIDFKPEDYVLAMYLSGLAVESILQAIALENGAAHDARHGLSNWLAKCPSKLHDAIKGSAAGEWSLVVALWDNSLRYLSYDGLIGYLRAKGYALGIKGGPEAVVRTNAKELVAAAEAVHKKGLSQWLSMRR